MRLENLQTIIKRTLFKPLFFNFPSLDKYSWIFRSRDRAYKIMKEFGDRLFAVGRSRPSKVVEKGSQDDQDIQVVHLLNSALDVGRITEKQYRDNIKITFLTAHENAQQLLNSAFWELGKNQVRINHPFSPCTPTERESERENNGLIHNRSVSKINSAQKSSQPTNRPRPPTC